MKKVIKNLKKIFTNTDTYEITYTFTNQPMVRMITLGENRLRIECKEELKDNVCKYYTNETKHSLRPVERYGEEAYETK